MGTPMIRGYSVSQTLAFVNTHYDDATRKKVMGGISPEIIGGLKDLTPAGWYPREYSAALLRGIASIRNNDQGSFDDLLTCGKQVATEATNSFLRLLMKVLTPAMFAKKIPEFYDRDMKESGRFEVDVTEAGSGLIRLRLVGAGGYDHIAITSMGWVEHGMAAMGKKDVKVTQKGWSMATPAPDLVEYEIRW